MVTFTDDAITSNTGRKVAITRDPTGRIIKITDPRGLAGESGRHYVEYQYDVHGDLVKVTDRLGNPTQFTYRTDRPHYLDQVIDPFGRTGVKTNYNTDGRLSTLTDAQNQTITLAHDPNARTETITDQLGKPATLSFDDRGNVTRAAERAGMERESLHRLLKRHGLRSDDFKRGG